MIRQAEGTDARLRSTDASLRRYEDAADALARLDLACGSAPPAFPLALRLAAISDIIRAGPKGTRSLAAAFADATAGELDPAFSRWRDFIDEEERRSRGGAPLTLSRLLRAGFAEPETGPAPDAVLGAPDRRTEVDRALRSGTAHPRPAALHRALAVSAAIGDRAFGEVAAALVLCVEGRTDRLRCLPFAAVPDEQRDTATRAWRDGDERAWTELALDALILTARARRGAIEGAMASIAGEDRSLDALGRAAINARRALEVLRRELVTTVPVLAGELGLSRPASDDAIARLVSVGLALELTGRRRDRVFAYAPALAITE